MKGIDDVVLDTQRFFFSLESSSSIISFITPPLGGLEAVLRDLYLTFSSFGHFSSLGKMVGSRKPNFVVIRYESSGVPTQCAGGAR